MKKHFQWTLCEMFTAYVNTEGCTGTDCIRTLFFPLCNIRLLNFLYPKKNSPIREKMVLQVPLHWQRLSCESLANGSCNMRIVECDASIIVFNNKWKPTPSFESIAPSSKCATFIPHTHQRSIKKFKTFTTTKKRREERAIRFEAINCWNGAIW